MKIECESCDGTGEVMYSCCTGDVIDSDIAMCPECQEHLGEETCEDCNGTGKVEEGTPLSDKPDLMGQADAHHDAKKYGEN